MSKMKAPKTKKMSAKGARKPVPKMQKPKGGNSGCYGDKMTYPK